VDRLTSDRVTHSSAYTHFNERLRSDDVIVMDGGTGTEIEAEGGTMDTSAWGALANVDAPGLVRKVHEEFIVAGAEVVIANTFAAARPVLAAAGREESVFDANRLAVEAVKQARDAVATGPVLILGSISSYPASRLLAGRLDRYDPPTGDALRRVYQEQVQIQVDAGIDALALEMMNATSYAQIALEVGLQSGVPVWLGVSPVDRGGADLDVVGDGPEGSVALRHLLSELITPELSMVGLMHCKVGTVDRGLEILADLWTGPLMVYPEAGEWDPPHWKMGEVSPTQLVANAKEWAAAGVQMIGGCCGVGPAHIRELRAGLPKHTGRSENKRT
jgi:S-methylmethionine-dependent homocysteine/selenocysteine methylase